MNVHGRESARVRKSSTTPVAPIDALAIIERYAQDHDLALQSDDFLALVERLCRQWGTDHEQQIALFITNSADVIDTTSYARVADDLRIAADREKQTSSFFEPRKHVIFHAHRLICDRESAVLKPLRDWVRQAKANWDGYRREQDRQRRDEEARLSEDARRHEQDRLQREAALLEQRGERQLAAQVLEQAVTMPAPVIALPTTLPETKGVAGGEAWTWRPLGGDTPQGRARAVQLVPREFLKLDDSTLTAYAKAHKASGRIPGIEIFDAGRVSVRT